MFQFLSIGIVKSITLLAIVYSDPHIPPEFQGIPIHEKASFVLEQQRPSNITYYRKDRDYFWDDGKVNGKIEGLYQRESFFFQSEDFLLTGSRFNPTEILIYFKGNRQSKFKVAGIPFVSAADYHNGRLYLCGMDGFHDPEITLQIWEDNETLSVQKKLPLERSIQPPNGTIIHSLVIDSQWLVWVPSQFKIFQFDNELKQTKTREITYPDHWDKQSEALPILTSLLRGGQNPKFQDACGSFVGECVYSIPTGFFEMEQGLAISFFSEFLKRCNPGLGDSIETLLDTEFRTELMILSKENFEITTDIITIPRYYVSGLYRNPNLLIGRVRSSGTSSKNQKWKYHKLREVP